MSNPCPYLGLAWHSYHSEYFPHLSLHRTAWDILHLAFLLTLCEYNEGMDSKISGYASTIHEIVDKAVSGVITGHIYSYVLKHFLWVS